MVRNTQRNGAPKANPSPHPLMRSAANVAGVVLLNPCFSSSTNVEYRDKGIELILDKKANIIEKAMD